jgi:N-acetyltransferase
MNSSLWPPDTILERDGIRLEPLALTHEEGLRAAAADGALWTLRVTSVPEPEATRAYIESALAMRAQGTRLAFAVIDVARQCVIGSTSYHDMIAAVKRVEIGYTWYAKSAQRSNVNTTCKLMLMAHAFDTLGCAIVGWRTDILNFASQRAIEKLGAKREGIIRHHAPRRDGTVRDTVMYGMLAAQWPDQKAILEGRLRDGGFAPRARTTPVVDVREIDFDNIDPVLRLNAGARGESLVASNAISLAQASVNANAVPRAIYDGETVVGFIMLYNPTRDPALAQKEEAPLDALYLWRFMVDFKRHGHGYGTAALRWAMRYAASQPALTRMRLSYVPIEGSAAAFYERHGFRKTGELDGSEVIMEQSVESIRQHLAA